MLSALWRFFPLQEKWTVPRALPFSLALSALLLPVFFPAVLLARRRLQRPPTSTPADATPLTDGQRRRRKTDFIESIDREAVCALASRLNGDLPCRFDEATPVANGSFNACFFVEFYTTAERTQWVVRIPIGSIVSQAWEKVQSEVCTLRYVREHTTIPVPQVHAYGRARLRHNDLTEQTCYIVMERVHGRPLDILELSKSPPETQRQFFASLIAILAQLRRLDFDAAGSLMPSGGFEALPLPGWIRTLFFSQANTMPKPVIVDAISIPTNELYIQGGRAVPSRPLPPPTSTTQFIDAGYRLLRDIYLMPKQDLSEAGARSEVFALHTMQQQQLRPPQSRGGRNGQSEQFVLTHTDLRGPNIIVDDEFRIQAVIDWEWAVTVPAAFFTPPSWLFASKAMLDEFYSTLASLPPTHEPSVALLQRQWLPTDGDDSHLEQHVARIFESPYSLTDVFYKSVYPRLFDVPRMETLRTFFLQPRWQEEIKQRVKNSERYTQYLEANNLYEVDEEAEKRAQQRRDAVAQAQAYLALLNVEP